MKSVSYLQDRGDTIVEVMIAIAIVSSVLAGAFTVTQKSSTAVRTSQERSEILQLMQGQVELVRAIALKATSETADIFDDGYFCIDDTTTPVERVDFTGTTNLDVASTYHEKCRELGSGDLYNIAVIYNDTTKVFTVTGRWDRIGGGINRAQLSYRIVPAAVATIPSTPSTPPAGPPPTVPPNPACVPVFSTFTGDKDVNSGTLTVPIPVSPNVAGGCEYDVKYLWGDTHPRLKQQCDASGGTGWQCNNYKQPGEDFFMIFEDQAGNEINRSTQTGDLPNLFTRPDANVFDDPNGVNGAEAKLLTYRLFVPAGRTVNRIILTHSSVVNGGPAGSVHLYGYAFCPVGSSVPCTVD